MGERNEVEADENFEATLKDEQGFRPDWFSKPGDSVRALIGRRGVDPLDIAQRLQGGMETLRGLLDGSRAVEDSHADALAESLGGTRSFWLKRQANYEIALEYAVDRAIAVEADEWLTLPVPGARPVGRMSDETRRSEVRRRLAFFNVGTFNAWDARYGKICTETRFRTSQALTSDKGAVLMWLRSGELSADLITTRPWNAGNLYDRLKAIRALSKVRQPERFLPKLKALCAEAGVAIVAKKAPDSCRASGASRMVAPDKAMILLSFRGLSDDRFWFTVFHEIGHLVLHGANTFVDTDMEDLDQTEREANDFASRCVVPENRSVEFYQLKANRDAVVRFSVSIGVSPGLTVGQMQHHAVVRRNEMNYLKRHWLSADPYKTDDKKILVLTGSFIKRGAHTDVFIGNTYMVRRDKAWDECRVMDARKVDRNIIKMLGLGHWSSP